MEIIRKYFPSLSTIQLEQYSKLKDLYKEWNFKINVISRKDIDSLYIRHVLHSLSIAKFIQFLPGARILDVGTGGGFPGIPLAIMFPDANFTLVDSIGKKIVVVNAIADSLKLENVDARHARAEQINEKFDFIVSRAVTNLPTFIGWVKDKISKMSQHSLTNGILALKGGDLEKELHLPQKVFVQLVSDYFEEPFFNTKKIVHVSLP
jgi:16S rRNA (guanine527-N7)-methyltransferase